MKKFILSVVVLLGLVFTTNAQMIVDAEMFKANPNQFMGKVVTIKNVVYKGSSITPGSPQGGVVSSLLHLEVNFNRPGEYKLYVKLWDKCNKCDTAMYRMVKIISWKPIAKVASVKKTCDSKRLS